ncbi:Carboxylesterase [Ilyonectria destructans]|nr:Carboxylesterase [Ilyonectria destructans]
MRSSTIFTPVVAAAGALAGLTVKLRNGTYEGYSISAAQQDHFLGMLFAQPPVGYLRFRELQGLNETRHGRRKAVGFGKAYMQYVSPPSAVPMSEDCLTINVFRPTLKSSRARKSLPVAVWFYGGGLYSGVSASYNITNFVQQSVAAGKPVIGITLNYHLSVFGFFWGSAELNATGSTNNGLRDQRLALHWIQEKIKAFARRPHEGNNFRPECWRPIDRKTANCLWWP